MAELLFDETNNISANKIKALQFWAFNRQEAYGEIFNWPYIKFAKHLNEKNILAGHLVFELNELLSTSTQLLCNSIQQSF